MKKLTLRSLMFALVMFPMVLSAQSSSIDKLFDKYSGEEGFTSVNISKSMFAFFAKLEGIEDDDFNEMQEVIDNLDGLKILSCDSKDSRKLENFRDGVNSLLKSNKFEELMVMKEQNSEVKFMIKNEGDDIVELLLIAIEEDDIAVISFFGIIDLQAISKLSKTVKINGMEKLEGLDKYKNR
jgi:hypothetical protein